MPSGGRRVWTSNWVPGVWSVREMFPGDNYHLALAYFLSGLGDDGWDIMKGTFLESGFNSWIPGNFGSKNSGTDFSDCSHMFARVLVEGLFGYRPDYPNGIVNICPQFPKEWDNASINLPDYSFKFHSQKNHDLFTIELKKEAIMDLYLPVQAARIKEVRIDGKSVKWELLPASGRAYCIVH